MKFLHAAAFALVLSLASVPVLYAQEPDQEKPKQQDEEKKKQPPAAKEKPQPKPDERAKSEPQPDREKSKQELDKPKQEKQQRKQSVSEPNQSATAERGSHKNVRRIPPERFQTSFGRQHTFRVQRRGDRQFQYGGYVFEVVEVWPVGWSYDDDCYIEEDGDDYYVVDVLHPEVRVLVVIVG